MQDKLFAVWLTTKTNFAVSTRRILEVYTPEEIYRLSKGELVEIGFSETLAEKLSDKNTEQAHRILHICRNSFIDVIPFWDEKYPESLLKTPDAPVIIYTKGDLERLKCGLKVGFVGTRTTSVVGREFSTRLAEELVSKGVVPISGAARGTDSYPLIAAIEKGLYCVAVLGCDINRFYPAEHYALLEYVSRIGLVISEYPPETNARWFPLRNRIIAALSDRLVVAEAPEKSGALITAEYAASYSKPVFAPDIAGENHAGCQKLLSLGAHRVRCAADVISNDIPTPFKIRREIIKKEPVKRLEKTTIKPIEKKEFSDPDMAYVYGCIAEGRDTVEKMVDSSHRPSDVMCALSSLELDGEITALPGGRYSIIS